jgi:hypothetical protein
MVIDNQSRIFYCYKRIRASYKRIRASNPAYVATTNNHICGKTHPVDCSSQTCILFNSIRTITSSANKATAPLVGVVLETWRTCSQCCNRRHAHAQGFKQSRRPRLGVESPIRRSSKVCLFKISSLVEWISMLRTSLLQQI